METQDSLKQQLRRLPLLQRIELEVWLQQLNAPPSGDRVEEAKPGYQVDEPLFMTLERYFDFEERSSIKHEFVNGFVFAMTGPSLAHVAVTGNLAFAFRVPPNGYQSDVLTRVAEALKGDYEIVAAVTRNDRCLQNDN